MTNYEKVKKRIEEAKIEHLDNEDHLNQIYVSGYSKTVYFSCNLKFVEVPDINRKEVEELESLILKKKRII